jgi:demethylmenaquinone methyltransferase/2-methoxy-6-polyprenyl-1,4-benzoquinol methylase
VSAETTDFGFETVGLDDKARRVSSVFDSVARRYDLMNDLMSFGLHRGWKRFAAAACRLRPGERVLDLAGGTGDMTRLAARRVGPGGEVVLCDVNAPMLARGRDRLIDRGHAHGVRYVQGDAERLPFAEARFDCAIIAFGLRNVTRKARALASIHEVLRPGGRLVILEFSRVTVPSLAPLYDAYSLRLLPRLGRAVAGDADSYRYLAESIRRHPDQEALAGMMREAGFGQVGYLNLSAGIVAVHRGYRIE